MGRAREQARGRAERSPEAEAKRGAPANVAHQRAESPGLRSETVAATAPGRPQVEALLDRAMEKRSVGCTQMNEQSSRSHMVFSLRIDGTNASSGLKARRSGKVLLRLRVGLLEPLFCQGSGRAAGMAAPPQTRTPGPSMPPPWQHQTHPPNRNRFPCAPKVAGVLNLIDLAGSERVKESGATGQRMKEAQAINKSRSALGAAAGRRGRG